MDRTIGSAPDQSDDEPGLQPPARKNPAHKPALGEAEDPCQAAQSCVEMAAAMNAPVPPTNPPPNGDSGDSGSENIKRSGVTSVTATKGSRPKGVPDSTATATKAPNDPQSGIARLNAPEETKGKAPAGEPESEKISTVPPTLPGQPGAGKTAAPSAGKTGEPLHQALAAGEHKPRETAEAGPEMPPDRTGMSGAKQQLPMQKAEQTNEISASAEQNLPVSSAPGASKELPGAMPRAAEKLAVTPASSLGGVTAATSAANTESPRPEIIYAIPAPTPERFVERVHTLMSVYAMRLRDTGNDSLQVVIKPTSDTHLSLDLRLRNGSVEMRAVLNRGDYNFLNQQWPALQRQLEPRGIRLAPLDGGDAPPDDGASGSPNSRGGQEEKESGPMGAFAEFALNGSLTTTARTRARTARGWQSWA